MMRKEFDLSGVSVHIGMPVHGAISPKTHLCLQKTIIALMEQKIPFYEELLYGCCYVHQARSYIADDFLKGRATHLFHLDADMVWTPNDFLRLLAEATEMPCVVGPYRTKTEDGWTANVEGEQQANEFNCVEVKRAGLGFCCVRREVMNVLAMTAKWLRFPDRKDPVPMIYHFGEKDGWFVGEDVAFLEDVRNAGFPVYLDLEMDLGHLGEKEYRGNFLETLQCQREVKPKENFSTPSLDTPGPKSITLTTKASSLLA